MREMRETNNTNLEYCVQYRVMQTCQNGKDRVSLFERSDTAQFSGDFSTSIG